MSTMSIGKIRDFNLQSGNWLVYIERIEMYFLANKISDDVKLPTLISLMGEETYELLSTLASPLKPSSLKYAQAVSLLQDHLQPKPSEMAERYRFRQCRQLSGESIADYVAELKKLSRFCNFQTVLEDNLRDQFVCGLQSEFTRQRMFAEEDLNYAKAVTLATTLEAAERDACAVERQGSGAAELIKGVNKLHVNTCTACGDTKHQKWDCRYNNFECSLCHKIGHLRRMCPKRSFSASEQARRSSENGEKTDDHRNQSSRGGSVRRGGMQAARGRRGSSGRGGRGACGNGGGGAYGRSSSQRPGTYWVQQSADEPSTHSHSTVNYYSGDDDVDEENFDEPMYQMSLTKYKPVCITLLVNNCFLEMEADTGAPLSCISKNTYNKYFNGLLIKSCRLNLTFYDGSIVTPLGYVETEVEYKNRKKILDLYIFDNGTTNLLGRQWLAELSIDIPKIPVNCIASENCNKNELINKIISRHKSLFDGTLGRYTGGFVSLCVRSDAQPVFCRARPLPYALRDRVDAELDAMLLADVIESVDRSDWATPLVIARKADGGIRICADYKVTLNRALMVDRYPVPKIEDLFSDLCGKVWFTKLDLSQAYNQLELDEYSRDYTVINTHRGLFKYKRLVYGLSSSPGIFQKFMINLFKNIPDIVIFYDDILIKSKDLKSHLKTIDQVLEILETNGLKIRREKCDFLTNEVRYLGYIVSKDGVKVNTDKIKPIISMPHPNNVTELKSFLGMVNFYGKFIKNLSTYLSELYELLKKGKHFKWTRKHSIAFSQVKKLLCSTEVLAHYDMSLETTVTCDASAYGLGAVLAQRTPHKGERVVAYASRALTSAEKHYSQIHKEALAIIFAVDKFHQYLYGRKFTLRTDHKPLVSIFGPNTGIPSTAASRLQRWAIKLSAYDFNIEYVKTDHNTADVLSRLIKTHKDSSTNDELPEQTYLHFATEALLLDHSILKKETYSDPLLSRIISYIRDGWPTSIEIKELKPYFNRKNELYTELGCILWGHRIVIPFACRDRVLKELHDSHMGIVKTKAIARSYVWWPGIDEAVEAVCRACTVCAAVAEAPHQQAPKSWPWPSRPWSRLHIDFLGPVSGLTYLVIVDACSKWIEAINMKRTTAQAVITVLRDIWARFGIPRQVVSDNGPPFTSTEFKSFLANNSIEQIFSAPYHPASNGAAENAVKICKRVIKKALKQNLDPDTALCRFLLTYRNTEHYTIGESPAKILQGRDLRTRLDVLKPDREARIMMRQARTEQVAGGAHRQMAPGDKVWYRDYRGPDKWVAGQIVKELGSTDYSVKSDFGTEAHRHVDQLRQRLVLPETAHPPPSNNKSNRKSRSSLIFPVINEQRSSGAADRLETTSAPELGTSSAASDPPPYLSSPTPLPDVPISLQTPTDESQQLRRYPLRNRKPPLRFGIGEID